MILYQTGFIMDQYGWKSELPDNFWWQFSRPDLHKVCEIVNGILGES